MGEDTQCDYTYMPFEANSIEALAKKMNIYIKTLKEECEKRNLELAVDNFPITTYVMDEKVTFVTMINTLVYEKDDEEEDDE